MTARVSDCFGSGKLGEVCLSGIRAESKSEFLVLDQYQTAGANRGS